MTEKSTFELINDLIISISHLLWPIVVLVCIIIFKKEISSLLTRIKKGKFFGQELELNNEIEKFETITEQALKTVTKNSNKQINIQDTFTHSRDNNLVSNIIEISRKVEDELYNISGAYGILKDVHNKSISYISKKLAESNIINETVFDSVIKFWQLRNQIVHKNYEGEEYQLKKISEIGFSLLSTLNKIPRSKFIVFKKEIDLFSDINCKNIRPDVKGLILKNINKSGITLEYNIYPTTREIYEIGDSVAWEWNSNNMWDTSYYIDNAEIKKAFDQAAEFVGRPLSK